MTLFLSFIVLSSAHLAQCGALGSVPCEHSQVLRPSTALKFETHIRGEPLVIEGERRFAGAISSITYRSKNYVNSDDHGRLFQGAIAFNGRYECLNPTQGGASRDRLNLGKRSTSRRLEARVDGSGFSVATRMAYWLRPGQTCTVGTNAQVPLDNRRRLSDVVYRITHRFGAEGIPHAAAMQISYTTETAQDSAVVEAVTIYTPPEFDTFHVLEVNTDQFTENPTVQPDESPGPVVISTADGAHAFAFVSKSGGATYGRWRFQGTNKISLVYRPTGPFSGTRQFDGYWTIGTRDEVMNATRQLLAAADRSNKNTN